MKSYLGSALMIAGAVAGYVTALQALGHAGTGPAPGHDRWTQGIVNPKDAYTIYALGHFHIEGFLPPPHATLYFTRAADDDGNALRSSCIYQLSGPAPQARWWFFSAGPLGDSASASSFSAGQAVLNADDGLSLAIGRKPQPGNWIAPPDSGKMQITLVMHEPYAQMKSYKLVLPGVKRLGCD